MILSAMGAITLLVMLAAFFTLRKPKAHAKQNTKKIEECNEDDFVHLREQLSSLEENLTNTKNIYNLLLVKLKDVRLLNTHLAQRTSKRKNLCRAMNIARRVLKKEKTFLLEKLKTKEKNQKSLGSADDEAAFKTLQEKNEQLLKSIQELQIKISESERQNIIQSEAMNQYKTAEETYKQKIADLKSEISTLLNDMIEEYKNTKEQEKDSQPDTETIAYPRETIAAHIGEFLLQDRLIDNKTLREAIHYQMTTGNSILQYLIRHKDIDELRLANWLNARFKIPYVKLANYAISNEITELIPVDLALKFWVMPVEKNDNLLIVAMVDPIDTKTIALLEEETGCVIRVWLAKFSEIDEALARYYKISLKKHCNEQSPLGAASGAYSGIERRRWIRINSDLDINLADDNNAAGEIASIDVSRGGFSFESQNKIPSGTPLTLLIKLPEKWNLLPISVATEVVYSAPSKNNRFTTGVKTLKISPQEIAAIMRYASSSIIRNASFPLNAS